MLQLDVRELVRGTASPEVAMLEKKSRLDLGRLQGRAGGRSPLAMHQVVVHPRTFDQAVFAQLVARFAYLLAPLLRPGGIRAAHQPERLQLERVRLLVGGEVVEHAPRGGRQLAVLLPHEFRVVVAGEG